MDRNPAKDPFFVAADIEGAETLPAEAFTDPAFLERELATLFRRSWLMVPQRGAAEAQGDPRSLADLVRRRGSRAPVSVAEAPLFLQRDWEGELHAFPNVCTHAWHTLVQGPDRDRSIACPQHGRKFDTTGRYVNHPGFEKAKGMPRACDHLANLPVHEWDPLAWVCLGAPAVAAEQLFAPIRESLGSLKLASMERRMLPEEVRDLPGNWKQHAWNYMDSLHIPFIHSRPGGLSEAVDLSTYKTELHDHAALQWAYARDPSHGFDPRLLSKRFEDGTGRRVYALWWFVFPNLTLNFYPWGLSVNLYAPMRGEPQKTRFHWYHYVLDAAKYAEREKIWMLRTVDDEDVDALTQVARGARSGFATRGRFAPAAEEGPHWFHRRVYEAVASKKSSEPAPRAARRRRMKK